MAYHETSKVDKVTYITPKRFIDALGPFDLDPCASNPRPWPTASRHFDIRDDGLSQKWEGMVWLNPPYGQRNTEIWMERMHRHGNGIALVFARTETDWFFKAVWGKCDGICFLKRRIVFCDTKGKPYPGGAGAPSVLISYGDEASERLRNYKEDENVFIPANSFTFNGNFHHHAPVITPWGSRKEAS